MRRCKLFVILAAAAIYSAATACSGPRPKAYAIADSKSYEASLYRQHCAVCHGAEGDGKTLDGGIVVPSLRRGEFKKRTEGEIFTQISEGGNGMTPFRGQLTKREIELMTRFVLRDLRGE